jgi:hypothetical protein
VLKWHSACSLKLSINYDKYRKRLVAQNQKEFIAEDFLYILLKLKLFTKLPKVVLKMLIFDGLVLLDNDIDTKPQMLTNFAHFRALIKKLTRHT